MLLMPCTTSTSRPRRRSCASEKSALASSPGSVMRYAFQGTCGCLLHSRARWQKLSHACAPSPRSTEHYVNVINVLRSLLFCELTNACATSQAVTTVRLLMLQVVQHI